MVRARLLDHRRGRASAASRASSPRCRTTRPPPGSRATRSPRARWTSWSPSRTPTPSRRRWSTRRSPGSHAEDLAGLKEQAGRAAEDGRRRGQGRSARSRPRTCRPPRPSSPTTSAPTAGTRCPTSPRRSTRSPRSTAATVYIAGAGGQAVDSAESFAGLDSTLAPRRPARGDPAAAAHLPQPGALDPADLLGDASRWAPRSGLIYFLAKYAGLTVNGQSQAIVSILVIGAGTDYALLLVARYREELRRHEDRHEAMAFALHRATPAIIASGGTVIVGMLCLTLAEMNSTAGLGPVVRHRHRRDAARDDHAAAGAARHLRPLDVLAEAPDLRLSRAHLDRCLGQGRAALIAPAAAQGVGRHRDRPRRRASSGVLTLNTNGLSTEDSYTKEFDSVKGQKVLTAHGLADNSTPVMVVANADKADEVADAMTRHREHRGAAAAGRQGRRRLHHRQPDRRRHHDGGLRHGGRGALGGARRRGSRRTGRRPIRDPGRHAEGQHPRLQGDHPGHAGRGAADPDAAAARRSLP